MNPQAFGAQLRAVPVWIRVGLVLVAFAIVMFWCATDSGLYRMFRDGPSQTATERVFYPRAALFALGAVLAPVVGVLFAMSRRYRA